MMMELYTDYMSGSAIIHWKCVAAKFGIPAAEKRKNPFLAIDMPRMFCKLSSTRIFTFSLNS